MRKVLQISINGYWLLPLLEERSCPEHLIYFTVVYHLFIARFLGGHYFKIILCICCV